MSLMSNPSFHPRSPAKFAETILRLAEAHTGKLREAFRNAAAMRQDALIWGRLEEACGKMLERRSDAAGELLWRLREKSKLRL